MKIMFTDSAIERLTPYMDQGEALLKLAFDTEGCGCSVNGVPTLWLVSEESPNDLTAETNALKLIYSSNDEIFMKIL